MYVCSSCNYASTTKIWKCPDCWNFGTFEKDTSRWVIGHKKNKHLVSTWTSLTAVGIHDAHAPVNDWKLSSNELLRILPNGIKEAWMYLLWWEPWIGKSTIMLQIISELLGNNTISIWYFSWEETAEQIRSRNERILPNEKKENNQKFNIYHTTHLEDILTTTHTHKHSCIIIDSIQTIYSESIDGVAWSPSQVKYCSEKISEYGKKNKTSCFIIWHVTKGGEIAGPKYLEHIVDVVLYLEWDRYGQYRFLRCKKNRFWSTDDVAIFEMWLFGLQPVYDLKERIIQQANVSIPWNVLTVGIDNWRPVLIQLEVLLNKTYGKYPQRVTQWIDPKRLQIICAILDRYLKLQLSNFDIYVNIPGEFQFRDNGLDLAVAWAIRSQAKNKIISKEFICLWELGLWWQVLPSKLHKKRSLEVKDFTIIDYQHIKHITELVHVI
jgi:DNA repair protein RadA/Sms